MGDNGPTIDKGTAIVAAEVLGWTRCDLKRQQQRAMQGLMR
jgi:hypothetical protein